MCRTVNGADINANPDVNPNNRVGRGNLAPATIIMPTIAMETKLSLKEGEDLVEKFIQNLDKKIHECRDMLIERYNLICSQSPKSAQFMWDNGTMRGYKSEEGIESALKHGTLSIGQLGLAETLEILIGCDHTTDKGMDLAIRIEKLFNDRCKEFKNNYKLNFGVYLTPKTIGLGDLRAISMLKPC